MSDRPALSSFPILIATWFGAGYVRKAPGTVGTLAALPFAMIFAAIDGENALLIAALIAIPLGVWSAEKYMAAVKVHDPGAVVIDEVAGMWIALLPVADALTWQAVVIGFVVFRFLDIFKPWPISWADIELRGGLGVMLDDILAGMFTAFVLYGLATWAPALIGMG